MVPALHDDELARKLWALGDAVRLRILRLLPETPGCDGGSNVSQLATRLGLSQPTVSHHLRVLRQAGFIEGRKLCRDVYYSLNRPQVAAVAEHLRQMAPEPALVRHGMAPTATPET